jgi:hypothetical protein
LSPGSNLQFKGAGQTRALFYFETSFCGNRRNNRCNWQGGQSFRLRGTPKRRYGTTAAAHPVANQRVQFYHDSTHGVMRQFVRFCLLFG